MTIEEAIARLSTCAREELRDHAFGDAEVYWFDGEEEVASGYFGRVSDSGVSIGAFSFEGEEAMRLRSIGRLRAESRNDSTGPEKYSEGETAPGLSLEDVLDELTSEGPEE